MKLKRMSVKMVKVTIDSGNPGKTIAIRADFDALPIQEDTGLSFASKMMV